MSRALQESDSLPNPPESINLAELTGASFPLNRVLDMQRAVLAYLSGRDCYDRWHRYWVSRGISGYPWLARDTGRFKVEQMIHRGIMISSQVQKAYITHPDSSLRYLVGTRFLLTPDEVGFLLLAGTLYQDRLIIFQAQIDLGQTDQRILNILENGFPPKLEGFSR